MNFLGDVLLELNEHFRPTRKHCRHGSLRILASARSCCGVFGRAWVGDKVQIEVLSVEAEEVSEWVLGELGDSCSVGRSISSPSGVSGFSVSIW